MIGAQLQILKCSYCCTKNGAIRGLVCWSLPNCHTFGRMLLIALYREKFDDDIPFKFKTSCPKQYFVWYNSAFRWMWKHSEKAPNSNRFPFKIPEGSFPHASITVIFVIKYVQNYYYSRFKLIFTNETIHFQKDLRLIAHSSIFFKPFPISLSSIMHSSSFCVKSL